MSKPTEGRLVIVVRAAQLDTIVFPVLLSPEDWRAFQVQCREHCHEFRRNEMTVMPKHRKLAWVEGPMREALREMYLIEDGAMEAGTGEELCLQGAGIVHCLKLLMTE